jgi:hypothetical protein
MSVKFEKETIKTAQVPGGKHEDTVHKIGEALTGGKTAQGYLAVWRKRCDGTRTWLIDPGIPQAVAGEPNAHKDAHLWVFGGSSGTFGLVDRKGP